MEGERKVVFVGAGNLRCAPPIIGTLASWHPPAGYELALFDANEERLDLMDRLARALFDEYNKQVTIYTTTHLSEAIADGTDILLALNEDGARRMTGNRIIRGFDALERGSDNLEIRRGDPNRPTPSSQLSESTKSILEVPEDSNLSREQAIQRATSLVLKGTTRTTRILSLMRDIEVESSPNLTQLTWPQLIPEQILPSIPFQILRWIEGDDAPYKLLSENESSPVRAWLDLRSN